jgi:hypothetical protein
MEKNIETWEADVASDLVWSAPHPEDGERREVEIFYVRLENERGERFRSKGFEEKTAARRFRGLVEAALAKGASPRGSAKWSAHYPRYASAAYSSYEELCWEKKVAESESFSR